jgi:Fur family peroxide stress response transcriptional regulator
MLNKNKRELLNTFREECRKHNIKITPQRVVIYEVLAGSSDHPFIEDVFKRVKHSFPNITIDTVYRTLSTFSNIGLVNVVEGYGEAKRYDSHIEPHHHFRCKKCHKIIDFQEESFNKLTIPSGIKQKCSVSNIKVVLEGLCDKCLKKK